MEKLSKILNETLIFRLIIAIGLIVMSLLPLFSLLIKVIMLSFSVLIAGSDSILGIIITIQNKDFSNYTCFVIYVCIILLFVIGYYLEGALICILYELLIFALDRELEFVRNRALNVIDRDSLDLKSYIYQIFDKKGYDSLLMEKQMEKTMNPALILGIAMGLIYAVSMPFIFNLTIKAAIHRAVSIIIICTPISIISSYRAVGSLMLCRSAANGIIFNCASALEVIDDCKYTLLDDSIFGTSSDRTKIIYAHSASMNNDTLLNFIYHVVYMSEQNFSKTIKRCLKFNYQTGIVFDTTDIPGYGIKATISGKMVLFGNQELCNRFGIDVSVESNPNIRGEAYYLCLESKCVGVVIISSYNAANLEEISSIYAQNNIKVALFSEKDELKTTKKPIFSIFYPERAQLNKQDVNLVIGEDPFLTDGCILPEYMDNISTIPYISRRVTEKAFSNSLIAFIFKVLIIMLSVTGFCVPWLAFLIDGTLSLILTILVIALPDMNLIEMADSIKLARPAKRK